jgi:hypothetical protein
MRWKQVLPQLAALEDPAAQELFSQAQEVSLPANSIVFHQGDACSNYLLVLDGSVKVLTRAENGREIVLYRLTAGDSCGIDRVLRIFVGLALISLVFVGPQVVWGWVGVVPLLTGLFKFCYAYTLFGIKTCPASSTS